MIQIIKGSIFDSKCDLIIIPCNNSGDVSQSVLDELVANNMPYYRKPIPSSNILFIKNTSAVSVSHTIGYAASVSTKRNTSTIEQVKSILRQIKLYSASHAIEKVNIPLLGSGAGGISAQESFQLIKAAFQDEALSIYVYVIHSALYNELTREEPLSSGPYIKKPRVFISYTATDFDNRTWVKNFATQLRENGVNARIDLFHLKPGQDLPQWMTNELVLADKVLLVCDKYYAEKADNRKGGVGWETMIIQGDMLSRPEQNKYVALLKDKDIDQSLPIYVKSRYALDWSDDNDSDEKFKELLICLFDCDIEEAVGPVPKFIIDLLAKRPA